MQFRSATIFTDLIVGFCGETDEQVANTAEIMLEVEFNMAYIAKYSPRIGARSARWEDDVTHKQKTERLARLTEVLKRTSYRYNEKMVGQKIKVLIEKKDQRLSGAVAARTEGKLPVRIENAPDNIIGTFQEVEIIAASELSLSGSLV